MATGLSIAESGEDKPSKVPFLHVSSRYQYVLHTHSLSLSLIVTNCRHSASSKTSLGDDGRGWHVFHQGHPNFSAPISNSVSSGLSVHSVTQYDSGEHSYSVSISIYVIIQYVYYIPLYTYLSMKMI